MSKHWTEERIKTALDGTHILVNQFTGEYTEMTVSKDYMPPYGKENPPKKTGPKKVKLTPIEETGT